VTAPTSTKPGTPRTGRRFGYLLAAALNGGFLYMVNNVLDWDVAPFLTNSFEEATPTIRLVLWATIIVNLAYLFFDPKWFKSLTQIGLAGISIAATVRLYQVFPFDFSEYDFPWETLTRTILIIAIVGVGISIIVETVKLAVALRRAAYSPDPIP
jgi:hypothetical protein